MIPLLNRAPRSDPMSNLTACSKCQHGRRRYLHIAQMKPDPNLPIRDLLLDAEMATALLNEVTAEMGASCTGATPTQVRYLPGSSITVRYRSEVIWSEGRKTVETLVAMAGRGRPQGGLIAEVDGSKVAIWRYPHDPLLPGLQVMTSREGLSAALEQLGASTEGLNPRTRVYRPGRRAVIEVRTARERLFVKVVKPTRVRALQAKHRVISEALPIPHSHGWSEELGLVVLQAIEGETLRTAVGENRLHHPSAAELLALIDRLPSLGEEAKAVGGPLSRSDQHATLLAHVLPDLEERVTSLVAQLGSPGSPVATVHGDFHSSQIIVGDSGLAGLIDVDSAGHGDPTDDMAMMLAQLSTLSLGKHGDRFAAYGKTLLNGFEGVTESSSLRRRVAAGCLGFATGPFRVQQKNWRDETRRRVKLAEEWLASI